MLKQLVLSTILTATSLVHGQSILGTWKVQEFYSQTAQGKIPFCQGLTGSLTYIPGHMSVALNCRATAPGSLAERLDGMLFYSGDMALEGDEVVHRVRNYSHPDLNREFRRSYSMTDSNHLRLSGDMADGSSIVITFERTETLSFSGAALPGLYELVGSENEIPGIPHPVAFCAGFNGSILFTPGGHASVSINCGEGPVDGSFEPAAQFGRKYFYAGTYRIVGDQVIVVPENASVPSQIGEATPRRMEFRGDILVLKGVNGSKFSAEWKKVESL